MLRKIRYIVNTEGNNKLSNGARVDIEITITDEIFVKNPYTILGELVGICILEKRYDFL